MEVNKTNISRIETYLNSVLDGVVSEHTYFGTIPDAAIVKSSDWQDMVMVEIPNGIADFDAYGQGTALVWLYARPMDSGRKNVAKMSQLETNLDNAIKNASSSEYYLTRRLTFTDYDTTINWHCNVIEIIITIV